jgi:hypothetical protein
MKRFVRVLGFVMGSLFLLLLLGIAYIVTFAEISQSASTTLRSGRSITATSHCWNGVDLTEKGNDTVAIDTAGYAIVIAPKQLIVDGHTFATIDGNAKSIDIDISKSKVAFKVDGARVGSLLR